MNLKEKEENFPVMDVEAVFPEPSNHLSEEDGNRHNHSKRPIQREMEALHDLDG